MFKQGYVIPAVSQITNEPIYMIIWGFREFSTNRKLTSNGKLPGMIQTAYIPRSWVHTDVKVTQARKVNTATCGTCPIKDKCYVAPTLLATLVRQVRKLVIDGNNKNYDYWDNVAEEPTTLAAITQILRLVGLRLGAYGNPSSVEIALNYQFIKLILDDKGKLIAPYTAYDHEVLKRLDDPRFAAYKNWVMASITAPSEWGSKDKPTSYWLNNPYPDWLLVQQAGMSSYCATRSDQPLFPEQRIHCPFVLNDLKSKGCAECKLCCGTNKGVKHIVEYWHGSNKGKANK